MRVPVCRAESRLCQTYVSQSPESFSDPESCFRSAVFILNIEVSIVLQAIR